MFLCELEATFTREFNTRLSPKGWRISPGTMVVQNVVTQTNIQPVDRITGVVTHYTNTNIYIAAQLEREQARQETS